MTLIVIISTFIGIAALVFGVAMMMRGNSNSAIDDRLDLLTSKSGNRNEATAERSVLHEPLDGTTHFLEAWFSKLLNIKLYLEQGDVTIPPSKFLMISGGLFLLGTFMGVLVGGHLALAPLAGLTLAMLPFGWAYLKRKRRLHKFASQLPDALELIARALRSGHSLAAGFQLVGTEMSQPLGKEFSRVYEEQNLGIPLEEALEDMTDRVPNLDLRFFATAVIIQRQSGGDLAEILDKIGYLIRERFKIYGAVQALTGEGRLSGIVLLALPPVLFVTMYRLNPGYVMMLFEDPMGKQMLFAALVLQAIGALVIRKIVNIRV